MENSVIPLIFLGVSVILNVFLDLYFVLGLSMGIKGAAVATVMAQTVSGIGLLFMLYGYYRAVNKPLMSVVLTVISLETRVALAYLLSGIDRIGVVGIWAAIPIGWFLADAAGIVYYINKERTAPYDI